MKPKPSILHIEPYKPGRATVQGFERPLKLSANENALGCSERAREAYLSAAGNLSLYPDPRANALRAALAERHKLDPERIIFGTGSDELFAMACQAYLQAGDVIVQPQYAFAAWAIAARAAGGGVVSAPEKQFRVDVDAMLAAVDSRTRLAFIANPANPTGTAISLEELKRLHSGLPENVLLVLDGAYAEFGETGNWFEAFGEAPNVFITRTFSKLYGLASLRLGWGYAPRAVASVLNQIRLPFNAAGPAQAAALAALEDEAFVQRSVAFAVAGRSRLAEELEALGLSPLPPSANFVTVHFPKDAPVSAIEACEGLANEGILVRGLAPYGMQDALRITVGHPRDLDRLVANLRRQLRR